MATEQYVKFRRGSNTDFQNLVEKDADTLYFIYDENESTADLYLGSKKISGDDGVSVTNLSKLEDISLNNLRDNDILIYDTTDKVWVNKPVENILNDYVENISTKVKVITNTDQKSHNEIMQSYQDPTSGNILIIKDLIAEDTYQHTAYVYDEDTKWHAMDGNYSAETIYFNNDFIFTKDLGAIEVPEDTGNITVEATGKNLKEFLSSVFAKEENPEVTQPSATIAINNSAYEVGSTLTPSYTIDFNEGSYSYGPSPTGVSATYSVTDGANTYTNPRGTFPEITIEDNMTYKINATIEYSDGATPKTNLGNDCEEAKIIAGTLNIESQAITGYRKSFYGVLNNKEVYSIRDLSSSSKALANKSTFTIDIKPDTQRVVIAYPDSLRDLTSVLDYNDSNANIVSGFGKPESIEVSGANNYESIPYKVYTMDFANPYGTSNKFTVTI